MLPKTEKNGHSHFVVKIEARKLEGRSSDILYFEAVLKEDDKRIFRGEVVLVPPEGVSVISDIDDTIKISEVTNRTKLLENTFLKDFAVIAGMPELYSHWKQNNMMFHYVSSSPWYLYTPLVQFLDENSFPYSDLHLKAFRFRDKSLLNLFKKGTETKPEAIEKIIRKYPKRKFYLVGDSGEQDPEVYAKILKLYPNNILHAYIREIEDRDVPVRNYKEIFRGLDTDKWTVFSDPSKLLK